MNSTFTEQNDGIEIRVGTLLDLPQLKPLWLEFMEYHANQDRRKYRYYQEDWPQVLKQSAQAIQDDHAALFVAEKESRMVGYVFGLIFTNFPGYFPKKVGFIRDLIVTQMFRQYGIGKKLVQYMETWFRDQEIEITQLYVAETNEIGFKFWDTCGYEKYLVGMCKELSNNEKF